MKDLKLSLFAFGAGLGLNFAPIHPLKAANFEWDFSGYNATGAGYLRFNDVAIRKSHNNDLFTQNGQTQIKLSQLASIPNINLKFDFELEDIAFFGYDEQTVYFYPNQDPELIFKWENGVGDLIGINYSDSQPLSMSSCHYIYCADFNGTFQTTWTGNTFVNQGRGRVDSYEWELVYTWDETIQDWVSDWELVYQESFDSSTYGGFEGLITFSTLEPVVIPEPLTFLGSGTAMAIGRFFKRCLSKKPKKN
ncbi:hypothetical protein PCC7424_1842 [Gloeothece citriformis PCC 7424]|uniref:PEP-CTERM protein-sorting domain-containing protein n=1 Tax=Gloeothece citriformis (strain PCC 7424) TaxID=65393 RepID=B7KCG9_GLOC7|nr:PEP-CTERM sorting domain-containing protein [Gloeothece citriformis]ACK70274.1 hypothetical protein PCC7424_1842 [Gloeothece citriformis PCC 7424]